MREGGGGGGESSTTATEDDVDFKLLVLPVLSFFRLTGSVDKGGGTDTAGGGIEREGGGGGGGPECEEGWIEREGGGGGNLLRDGGGGREFDKVEKVLPLDPSSTLLLLQLLLRVLELKDESTNTLPVLDLKVGRAPREVGVV